MADEEAPTAEFYRQRAMEVFEKALAATNHVEKRALFKLVHSWLELARRADEIEKD